jgi:hypothetical protein
MLQNIGTILNWLREPKFESEWQSACSPSNVQLYFILYVASIVTWLSFTEKL